MTVGRLIVWFIFVWLLMASLVGGSVLLGWLLFDCGWTVRIITTAVATTILTILFDKNIL